jgi:hypothetical protein
MQRIEVVRRELDLYGAALLCGAQVLAIPREQMTADLERLFGPGWRTTNAPR